MHLIVGDHHSTGYQLLIVGIVVQLLAHAALYVFGMNYWEGFNIIVLSESFLESIPGCYGIMAWLAERFDNAWAGNNPLRPGILHLQTMLYYWSPLVNLLGYVILGLGLVRTIFSWLAFKLAFDEAAKSVASDFFMQSLSLLASFSVNFSLYFGMVHHLRANINLNDRVYNYSIADATAETVVAV